MAQTFITPSGVIFQDSSVQITSGTLKQLGSFELTVPSPNYVFSDYDTGVAIEADNVMFAYKRIGFSWERRSGLIWASTSNAVANNVYWGWTDGHNTWGNWHRTRWSGPHRLIVNMYYKTINVRYFDPALVFRVRVWYLV